MPPFSRLTARGGTTTLGPMLLAALLLAHASPQAPAQVTLCESPAARAWAGVGPETVPVDLDELLFAEDPWLLDPSRADPAQVWERWGTWLGAEGRSESADPRRRAGLCLLAVHHRRWEDAWAHFARLGAAPPWAAAVVPALVPGVPIDQLGAAADPGRSLPEGLVLRPAVPPRPADDPPTSLRPREMWARQLRIGGAVLDTKVSIEPSGLEVDLWHLSGEAVEVAVLLPEPPGQEIRVEYIDWMRQDERRVPLRLELVPGSEEHNLFGRFSPRRAPLPALPEGALPAGIAGGGLWISLPASDELERTAAPVARALSRLFDVPGGTLAHGMPLPPGSVAGVRIELESGAAGLSKLVAVVSLAETYVLAGGLLEGAPADD